MKSGVNDWAITLSFPWGFIKVNDLSLPPITLKILFVRFSFHLSVLEQPFLRRPSSVRGLSPFSPKLVLVRVKLSQNFIALQETLIHLVCTPIPELNISTA